MPSMILPFCCLCLACSLRSCQCTWLSICPGKLLEVTPTRLMFCKVDGPKGMNEFEFSALVMILWNLYSFPSEKSLSWAMVKYTLNEACRNWDLESRSTDELFRSGETGRVLMPAESSSGLIPKSCQSSWSLKPYVKNGKTLQLFGAWNMPWILDNTSLSLFFCFDIGHWFCDLLDIMGDTAFCYFNDPQDLYILPLLQNLGWCQVVDNRHSDQKHSKTISVKVSKCPFHSKCKRFGVIALHKWKIWRDEGFKLERGSFRDITYWMKVSVVHGFISHESYRKW